jgi:hypothetical protein
MYNHAETVSTTRYGPSHFSLSLLRGMGHNILQDGGPFSASRFIAFRHAAIGKKFQYQH